METSSDQSFTYVTLGAIDTSASGAHSTTCSSAVHQNKALSTATRAGVGIGSVIGIVLLLGFLLGAYVYYWRRKWRKLHQHNYIVTPFIYTLRIKGYPEPDLKQETVTVS